MENLIVIPGVQKSGTSTLVSFLSKKKEIVKPRITEPCFYLLKENKVDKYQSRYESLVKNKDSKYNIDATTLYMNSESAIRNIKKHNDNIKVIIAVRDPAERSYSAYCEARGIVPTVEERSYKEIIDNLLTCIEKKGQSLKSAERGMLDRAAQTGQIDKQHMGKWIYETLNENFNIGKEDISKFDNKWQFRYFSHSMYDEKIKEWKRHIGEDRVYVCHMEDLINQPRREKERVLAHVGLISTESSKLPRMNKTRIASSKIQRRLRYMIQKSSVVSKASQFIPKITKQFVMDWIFDQKNLSTEMYWKTKYLLKKEYVKTVKE